MSIETVKAKELTAVKRDASMVRATVQKEAKLAKQLQHITQSAELMTRAMADMEDVENSDMSLKDKIELRLKIIKSLQGIDLSRYKIESKASLSYQDAVSLWQEVFMMTERVIAGDQAVYDAWCLQAAEIINKYMGDK
jgi:hypothetical protein